MDVNLVVVNCRSQTFRALEFVCLPCISKLKALSLKGGPTSHSHGKYKPSIAFEGKQAKSGNESDLNSYV